MARDSARVVPAPHGHHPAGHPLLRGAVGPQQQTEEAVEPQTGAKRAGPQEPLRDVRTWMREAAEVLGAAPVESGGARPGHLLQAMFHRPRERSPAGAP